MRRQMVFYSGVLLLTGLGVASRSDAQAGYTDASTISELNPREYGMDVRLPQANNPANCATPGFIRILKGAENYAVLAATLMTAAAQGKPVSVYVHRCETDGASVGVAVRLNY